MVMALPPTGHDSVAGGLLGGFCGATASGGVAGGVGGGVCWANRVAAAMKRPVQTKRRFMVIFLLCAETLLLVGRLQRDDCRTLRPVGVTGSGSWGAISCNSSLIRCRMTQGRCVIPQTGWSKWEVY